MKSRILLFGIFIVMVAACGENQASASIIGRWEMDGENGPGLPAYEFFTDGKGLCFREYGAIFDIEYSIKGKNLEINTGGKYLTLHEIKLESENKFGLRQMDKKGKVLNEQTFFRKPMVELPAELKALVHKEIYLRYTIQEASLSPDENDTWHLSVQVAGRDQPEAYHVWKASTTDNWYVTKGSEEEEEASGRATSAATTQEAIVSATKEAVFSATIESAVKTDIARMELITPNPTLAGQDLSGLVPLAYQVCRQSFPGENNTPLAERAPAPGVVIKDTDYTDGNEFTITEDYLQQAMSADEVKTLVCILTDRKKSGDYTQGSTGYRLVLHIHLVRWPEGVLLSQKTIEGRGPGPFEIVPKAGDPIYGAEPMKAVMEYLLSVIE